MIDRIDPIRADIAELRHAMEAALDKSAKEQLRFFFLAWGVQLAAIVGLYGTLIALTR